MPAPPMTTPPTSKVPLPPPLPMPPKQPSPQQATSGLGGGLDTSGVQQVTASDSNGSGSTVVMVALVSASLGISAVLCWLVRGRRRLSKQRQVHSTPYDRSPESSPDKSAAEDDAAMTTRPKRTAPVPTTAIRAASEHVAPAGGSPKSSGKRDEVAANATVVTSGPVPVEMHLTLSRPTPATSRMPKLPPLRAPERGSPGGSVGDSPPRASHEPGNPSQTSLSSSTRVVAFEGPAHSRAHRLAPRLAREHTKVDPSSPLYRQAPQLGERTTEVATTPL